MPPSFQEIKRFLLFFGGTGISAPRDPQALTPHPLCHQALCPAGNPVTCAPDYMPFCLRWAFVLTVFSSWTVLSLPPNLQWVISFFSLPFLIILIMKE